MEWWQQVIYLKINRKGDFTIIIRNLPYGNYNEKELKSEIEKWWLAYNISDKCFITKINIAYDIMEYTDLCLKKRDLVTKKKKMTEYKIDK